MVVSRAAAVAVNKKAKKPVKRAIKRPVSAKYENVGIFGNKKHDAIAKWFAHLRDQKWFQTFIICVIFVAGALVGIQTYDVTHPAISGLDNAVLVIFIVEIVVKLVAEGKYPHRFFKDSWNCFDFIIVVVGLLPIGGGGAVTALRLIRLLRVLKLVRALPKLRILVMGLLKSMSSIAYIGLLLGLLFYLYAVLGVILFSKNDPVLMGTLHIAALTLFRCATLEDWTDVMYTAMVGCDNYGNEDECEDPQAQPMLSVAYFVSFIILSSMMILNLFIGVITSSMQDAKTELMAELEAEQAAKQEDTQDAAAEEKLGQLSDILTELQNEVSTYATIEKERKASSVITLSNKNILANNELTVIHKNVKAAEQQIKTQMTNMSLRIKRSERELLAASKTPTTVPES